MDGWMDDEDAPSRRRSLVLCDTTVMMTVAGQVKVNVGVTRIHPLHTYMSSKNRFNDISRAIHAQCRSPCLSAVIRTRTHTATTNIRFTVNEDHHKHTDR